LLLPVLLNIVGNILAGHNFHYSQSRLTEGY